MGGDGAPILSDSASGSANKIRMVDSTGKEILGLSDLGAARNEFLFRSPLTFMAKDERDHPMVHLQFNITVTVLPAAAALFLCELPLWVGPLYVLGIYAIFFQRFVLCLHYSEHRKIFKPRFGVMNGYLQYVIAPFMGIPIGMYHLHHVVMHHKENNVFPWDLSSTEPYQRDNFLHFLHYLGRFTFAAWIELPIYAVKRKKYGLAAQALATAVGYITMVSCLWRVNAWATTFVFLIPFTIASFALMFGNWSQHIFIDPSNPRSNYGLSYNCMNHFENQKTFNDGYHIIHHCKPGLHWTQMPDEFLRTLDKHAAERAFNFAGAHFFEVGLWTMMGNYNKLASTMVHLLPPGAKVPPASETIAELKRRLRPVIVKEA